MNYSIPGTKKSGKHFYMIGGYRSTPVFGVNGKERNKALYFYRRTCSGCLRDSPEFCHFQAACNAGNESSAAYNHRLLNGIHLQYHNEFQV